MRGRAPYNLMILVVLAASCSACRMGQEGEKAAAPGDSVSIEESFRFYFERGENRYAPVRPEVLEDLRRFILSDVFWKSSDDVQVETTKLELSLAEVFAGHGSEKDTYYSANGLELRISCVAHVAEQAPPGLRQIFAEAPGLARASTALGALAVFEKRYLLSSGTTIKVKDLYIHGSQFSKITSLIAGNWKGIVALLMIVALIASGIRKVFA